MLVTGFRADFVVLDQDSLGTKPEELDTVKVAAAYVEGHKVYERT